MFDELRFRLKVKKIRRQEKKQMAQIRLEYTKKYGSDASKYTSERLDELMDNEKISVGLTQEEIANAYTSHLLEQMDKFLLQQPGFLLSGAMDFVAGGRYAPPLRRPRGNTRCDPKGTQGAIRSDTALDHDHRRRHRCTYRLDRCNDWLTRVSRQVAPLGRPWTG